MSFIGRWSGIGFRLSALSLIIVLISVLSTGAIGYFALQAQISRIEDDVVSRQKTEILQFIEKKSASNEAIAATFAQSDVIQTFIKQEDRAGLLTHLRGAFAALSAYDINNAHFHRRDMRTFARLHAPHQFDDDLSNLRPMILDVIRTGQTRRGLELGVNGLPIRGAAPIISADGERLGAVEVGSFMDAKFLASIEKPGAGHRIHLVGAAGIQQIGSSGSLMPPALPADALKEAASGKDVRLSRQFEGGRFISHGFALRDYEGKIIGVLETHLDVGDIDLISGPRLQFFALAVIGLVISAIAATLLSTGGIFRRLDRLIFCVKAIAAGSSQEPPPMLRRRDGFGDFARAIEGFRTAKLELREALRRAEESDRAKSQFLSVMSHELRTPLNAIIGFAEMITLFRAQNVSSAAKEQEYVDHIQSSGKHLLAIIEDILTVSSINAGELKATLEPIDIREDVDFVVQLMRGRMAERKLAFSQEIAPALPLVMADGRAIRQILLNLLSNAMKFTPTPGAVALTVRPDEAWLTLSVTDTGPGIAPEHLGQVRAAFFQVEPAVVRSGGGVGLGLSIVQELVTLHKGALELSNRPEGGFSAVVRLPIAKPSAPLSNDQPACASSASMSSSEKPK